MQSSWTSLSKYIQVKVEYFQVYFFIPGYLIFQALIVSILFSLHHLI